MSKQIEDHRKSSDPNKVLEVQAQAFVQRKTCYYRRNVVSTIFEVMVPVALLTIGLCFTKLEFDLTLFSRRVIPELFPLKQRLLFNYELPPRKGNFSWKGESDKHINAPPPSDEEFEDDYVPPPVQDLHPI